MNIEQLKSNSILSIFLSIFFNQHETSKNSQKTPQELYSRPSVLRATAYSINTDSSEYRIHSQTFQMRKQFCSKLCIPKSSINLLLRSARKKCCASNIHTSNRHASVSHVPYSCKISKQLLHTLQELIYFAAHIGKLRNKHQLNHLENMIQECIYL